MHHDQLIAYAAFDFFSTKYLSLDNGVFSPAVRFWVEKKVSHAEWSGNRNLAALMSCSKEFRKDVVVGVGQKFRQKKTGIGMSKTRRTTFPFFVFCFVLDGMVLRRNAFGAKFRIDVSRVEEKLNPLNVNSNQLKIFMAESLDELSFFAVKRGWKKLHDQRN